MYTDERRASPEQLTSGKIPLAITLAVVAVIYAMWQNLIGLEQSPVVASAVGTAAAAAPDVAGESPLRTGTPPAAATSSTQAPHQPAAPQKPSGLYADGSYTGSAADAFYGTVQVQATIQDGKIADVAFLQYPNDRSNSRVVNGRAVPLLTQEAVQAQDAQVSGVSGATFTSEAFRQSLASALALAKK